MFIKLLRVFLRESFGARRLFGSKVSESRGKVFLFVGLFAFSFISMGFSTGSIFYAMGPDLNVVRVFLTYVASYSVGLGFIFTIFQANGLLFQFKDYDILGPLPLRPFEVLLAKLITMMTFIYIITFALTSPIIIVYLIRAPFNVLSLLYLLIGYLILPLPAIILGSFASLLIAKIGKHFKKSNLIQIILLFALFLTIFIVSTVSSMAAQGGSFIPLWVIEAISSIYLPNEWFAASVHDLNFLNFVYLIVSHLGLFALFLFIVTKLSVKANQNRVANKEVIIKSRETKKAPIFMALLKKEWRKFVGTPIYIFNSGMGLIMLIIFSAGALFFKDQIVPALGSFGGFVVLGFFAFCLSTVYTPAVSLSLEGKNFALLKTLPIKGETIVSVKTGFNLLLSLPIILVSFPLAAIALNLDIWVALASFLAIVSFSLVSSSFYAWLNIWFPRFDFKNEAEVVKQSMSAFLAVFGGFAIIIVDAAMLVGLLFIPLPSIAFAIAFLAVVNCLLAVAIYLPLHKNASFLIQKMDA